MLLQHEYCSSPGHATCNRNYGGRLLTWHLSRQRSMTLFTKGERQRKSLVKRNGLSVVPVHQEQTLTFPKSEMNQIYFLVLEIKVLERGGRVERHRIQGL